jgi:hypothetical protein
MAAASKVVTPETTTPALANEAKTLAALIKQQHIQIKELSNGFVVNKKRLAEISSKVFVDDLSKDIPEVYGNHEYETEAGNVSVNFKITGPSPKEINGKPAAEIIREKFKETTDDLFEIGDVVTVTADEPLLFAQAIDHPEMFQVALKPEVTHADMIQLISAYPEMFRVSVIQTPENLKKYAEVYPDTSTKTSVVHFKKGFIEALSKIPDVAKKSVRTFIMKLLPLVAKPSVYAGK